LEAAQGSHNGAAVHADGFADAAVTEPAFPQLDDGPVTFERRQVDLSSSEGPNNSRKSIGPIGPAGA
jgi:hypothetical protein